ncbi:MAG TPA: GNAT family N-acetyltransferase [Dehalococcoidales bacterium]|nr:GNAT family N-acetyltransferase [Dehalococcoidales bacterium]
MIRRCRAEDAGKIYSIINEAAKAYDGVIAADCYHQPYMPEEELQREIKRVIFYGWEVNGELVGIMGIEPIKDITLIRHAYVLPQYQNQGIGTRLLEHLKSLTTTPSLLVGTWTAAHRAIAFYQKHGFNLLPDKDKLLADYWDIPPRQIETSVVMGIEINNN